MEIGDWIWGLTDKKEKVTGFVVEELKHSYKVCGTLYQDNRIVRVRKSEARKHNKVILSIDDLPTLIDLALHLRDEKWFYELTEELNRWKPVENIM
ncbi:IDEAL domain protein [compost metagenome]